MSEVDGDRAGRATADALLRQIEEADRARGLGRLKIFLGYASGIGKSFRLFDEGRRRHERGEDVVVAGIPPALAPEVAQIVRELELIPSLEIAGVPVLDMPALLARSPRVCLIDGLAYDNPPGSRHDKRYQDVEALLAAGISVITSVNLEYIQEQQSFVREVVGRVPEETVPQEFITRADEVVVVDAPPDAKAETGHGLSILRQRTLLLVAGVVDRQLEAYLELHGFQSRWGTQERILVCMTPRANAARMLASGRRDVDRFHGELFAIYVTQDHLTEEDRMANERNAALARAQQAHTDVLEGDDAVATIIDYARRHSITQIFVGHSLRRTWTARFSGTPLERLIRAADGMDVRVFPQ